MRTSVLGLATLVEVGQISRLVQSEGSLISLHQPDTSVNSDYIPGLIS